MRRATEIAGEPLTTAVVRSPERKTRSPVPSEGRDHRCPGSVRPHSADGGSRSAHIGDPTPIGRPGNRLRESGAAQCACAPRDAVKPRAIGSNDGHVSPRAPGGADDRERFAVRRPCHPVAAGDAASLCAVRLDDVHASARGECDERAVGGPERTRAEISVSSRRESARCATACGVGDIQIRVVVGGVDELGSTRRPREWGITHPEMRRDTCHRRAVARCDEERASEAAFDAEERDATAVRRPTSVPRLHGDRRSHCPACVEDDERDSGTLRRLLADGEQPRAVRRPLDAAVHSNAPPTVRSTPNGSWREHLSSAVATDENDAAVVIDGELLRQRGLQGCGTDTRRVRQKGSSVLGPTSTDERVQPERSEQRRENSGDVAPSPPTRPAPRLLDQRFRVERAHIVEPGWTRRQRDAHVCALVTMKLL